MTLTTLRRRKEKVYGVGMPEAEPPPGDQPMLSFWSRSGASVVNKTQGGEFVEELRSTSSFLDKEMGQSHLIRVDSAGFVDDDALLFLDDLDDSILPVSPSAIRCWDWRGDIDYSVSPGANRRLSNAVYDGGFVWWLDHPNDGTPDTDVDVQLWKARADFTSPVLVTTYTIPIDASSSNYVMARITGISAVYLWVTFEANDTKKYLGFAKNGSGFTDKTVGRDSLYVPGTTASAAGHHAALSGGLEHYVLRHSSSGIYFFQHNDAGDSHAALWPAASDPDWALTEVLSVSVWEGNLYVYGRRSSTGHLIADTLGFTAGAAPAISTVVSNESGSRYRALHAYAGS